MSSPDYSQDVADIIDDLGDSPTADEVYHAVQNYSVDYVVAAAVSEAKSASGGGGGSQTETAHLSAADLIAVSNDVSLDVVEAPGVGKMLLPERVLGIYRHADHAYTPVDNTILIGWEPLEDETGYALFVFKDLGPSDLGADGADQLLVFGGPDSGDFTGAAAPPVIALELVENQPLSVCWKGAPLAPSGGILTAAVYNENGGSLYTVGDTGEIPNNLGGDSASYVVDAETDGHVTAFTVTAPGTNFSVGQRASASTTTGTGSGLTVVVDTTDESGFNGDGTLDLTIVYRTIDLNP